MNVSVALASYNGEKYIEEQISSICSQLDNSDELVISDDGSSDNTLDIIKSLCERYSCIKLINGPQKGIVANFGNAMQHCKNDIIFLSDQDDIWCPNKVDIIKSIFSENPKAVVILHNATVLKNGNEEGLLFEGYNKGVISNLIKSAYWGCCMAVKREFIHPFLPFNDSVIAHDQLIGLLAEHVNGTIYLPKTLIMHRIHETNKTKKLSLNKKLSFRLRVLKDYYKCKKEAR